MTKSKKISIILCSILFVFLGFFGIFLANNKDSVVKADSSITIYQYYGSTFNIRFSRFSTLGSNSSISSTLYDDGLWRYRYENGNHYLDFIRSSNTYTFSINVIAGNYSDNWIEFNTLIWNTYRYLVIPVFLSSSSYNGNIVKIQFEYQNDGTALGFVNASKVYFYDDLNNYIMFQFPIWDEFSLPGVYSVINNTTYYLNTNFTDNQYFEAGRQQGLSDNQSNIFDEGYQKAIADNKQIWVNQGIQQGIEQANTYTFLGLIGATIDAPINAFTSFFDFELLGVNLKDFFFAILTFALVIVIVRFALAR